MRESRRRRQIPDARTQMACGLPKRLEARSQTRRPLGAHGNIVAAIKTSAHQETPFAGEIRLRRPGNVGKTNRA
jgi:hypothetical protein